jgi:DegV family protein with EDD domain
VEPRFSRPEDGAASAGPPNGSAPTVAVVSDTTAYLPSELVRNCGIHLVSLYVNWDDGSERESEMPNFDDFYRRLRIAEHLPTTSQPSIGDFLEVYEPLVDQGLDVVSIHISGGISGTVDSARQAAERIAERHGPDRVTVLDSETACGGLGLTVVPAARAAQAGASRAEVVERMRDTRRNLKMWFAVDTLEFLRRGGRIGAAQAWLGTALKVKPILTIDSEITPIERVRTGARALRRLLEYAEQRKEDGADAWVVQHIQAPEEAAALVEATQKIMGKPPFWVSEVGPVIGAHVGPGLLGIGGIPPHVLDPTAALAVAGDSTSA